jgi:hypothetical protein
MRIPGNEWLLTALVPLVTSCSFEPARVKEPDEPYEQLIAVGARVELVLTTCQSDRALVACLPSPVRELQQLIVEGEGLRLVGIEEREGEVVAEVEAEEVGVGQLRFAYKDTEGRQQTVQRPLRAVEVSSVTLLADCPLDRAGREPLLIGAGSELSVRLEPHTRQHYRIVATGQLPLLDFAGFTVLSSEGHETTLRAPERAGEHVWRDLAGVEHVVQVYDASTFPLRLLSSSGPPFSVHVRSDLGETVVCSAPTSVTRVELQVTIGSCAVGLGGVQVEPKLWLPFASDGALFRVYGQGSCVLAARLGDGAEARLYVPDLPPPAPSTGSLVDTEPVTFAVTEPLPATKCDSGVTDGKCGLRFFPIPDADCLTDADWKVELYDSAGPITSHDYVGTSLTFSMRLGVTVGPEQLEGQRAPLNVKYHYDERLLGLLASAEDIHVSIGECVAPAGDTRVAQVRADAVGPHQLEFEASNLNDTAEVDFAARGTDRCPIQASHGTTTGSAGELSVLEGSTVHLAARCEREDGLKLRGDTPLTVTRELAEPIDPRSEQLLGKARITNSGEFYVGAGPASYLVTSKVGAGRQRIVVLSSAKVHSLLAAPLAAGADDPELYCSELSGLDAEGKAVLDGQLVRVTATLPTDGSFTLDPMTAPRRVCVRRLLSSAPGQTLSLQLGSARVDLPLP